MFGFLHPGVSVVWIVCCHRLGWSCVYGYVGRIAICNVMISLAVLTVSGLIAVGIWFCRVTWSGVLVLGGGFPAYNRFLCSGTCDGGPNFFYWWGYGGSVCKGCGFVGGCFCLGRWSEAFG